VVDKKSQVHLLDLGTGLKVDKTPEGLQAAYRKNLLRFADHVINNTRYTNKEAQAAIRGMKEELLSGGAGTPISGILSDGRVKIIESALRKSGMPLRHMTERAATAPAVMGTVSGGAGWVEIVESPESISELRKI